jgi:hypothetical protein
LEDSRLGSYGRIVGKTYYPGNGRPGISTRLMVALHYLKYTLNLNDGDVFSSWFDNTCRQYLTGMKWFEQELLKAALRRYRTFCSNFTSGFYIFEERQL